MTITEKQWQLIYQSLVGLSGPAAKFVSLFFNLDESATKAKIDAVLNIIALLTPIISTVWIVVTNKPVDQLRSVASLPPEQITSAAAQLPPAAVDNVAGGLPDKTIVSAAGGLAGVNVVVGKSASPGAKEAANDPNVPGVNPLEENI